MMSKWQPIETAPKDGTCILVYDSGVSIGYWLSESSFVGRSGWSIGNDDSRPEDDYELWVDPTHWMPLPQPPNADNV